MAQKLQVVKYKQLSLASYMFPGGVLQRGPEQHMCYRARYAMLAQVSALQRHASDGGTGC